MLRTPIQQVMIFSFDDPMIIILFTEILRYSFCEYMCVSFLGNGSVDSHYAALPDLGTVIFIDVAAGMMLVLYILYIVCYSCSMCYILYIYYFYTLKFFLLRTLMQLFFFIFNPICSYM